MFRVLFRASFGVRGWGVGRSGLVGLTAVGDLGPKHASPASTSPDSLCPTLTPKP